MAQILGAAPGSGQQLKSWGLCPAVGSGSGPGVDGSGPGVHARHDRLGLGSMLLPVPWLSPAYKIGVASAGQQFSLLLCFSNVFAK